MPRLSRDESRAATRERLRSAAVQEFAQRGVGAASIDRIAEAAGFSRGAFYSNYPGKRDLLMELVNDAALTEVTIWTGLVEQAQDLDSIMEALAKRFDSYAGRGDWGLLQVELQLEAERDPEFGRLYRARTDHLMTLVTELVRSLFAKHGPVSDPQVELTARTLRALSVGLLLQGRHGGPDTASTGFSPGHALVVFLRGALLAARSQPLGGEPP